ncbi:MAG: hypothetical protein IJZ82_04315 [Lachnospiraceae bacterium]|nr:hypothetical protein [Lachnospiraceae bacterium]
MGINGIGYENYVNGNLNNGEELGNVAGIPALGKDKAIEEAGKTSPTGKTECQTCKNRKYVDGSNEMVSFKAPAHISPEAAPAAVRAHEGEHVSNAFKKAATGEGKVLQASVAIHTSICPECGRSYVSGGTTTTKIAYKEENPYEKNLKGYHANATTGDNVDTYAE